MRGRLLLILAAAGCATAVELPAPSGVAADDPRVAACREEARDAPEVRLPFRGARGDAPAGWARRDVERAMLSAHRECLEREDLGRGGGVEPVRDPAFRPPSPTVAPEPGPGRGVPLGRPVPTGF
ncbi:MAG: hypothetical protein SNJ73_07865 [Acetobacteraceae bacterium]